jgi:cytochrome c-type biogenesis protein CcmF
MSIIGFYLLILSSLSSLINFILGFKSGKFYIEMQILKYISICTAILSFTVLILLMVNGDTNIKYVSDHLAPASSGIGYKIAAAWAGQAGGLLLWASELALISCSISIIRQRGASMVLSFIMTALTGMVLLNNPFAISTVELTRGGLNPILQNRMMLIHPPMLFLGYALLAMPFAITIGALIENDYDKWKKDVKLWLLLATIALTAGNGFGALWAYRTFGWGGFWSWDPVENTSFVPWILSIASLHAIHLSKTDGRWLRPAAISALFAFITVIYGSFLARSGLLAGASIHAYIKGEQLLLITLGTLLTASFVSSIYFILIRWRQWLSPAKNKILQHKITAYATITLFIIAIIVLIGMSLPIFHFAPQTEVYNLIITPFALLFSIFIFLQFRSNRFILWSLLPISLVIISVAMPEWVQSEMHSLNKLQAYIDIFLLSFTLTNILGFSISLIVRITTSSISSSLSHIGIMLIISGAIISGHQNGKVDHFITSGTTFKYAGEIITINKVWENNDSRVVEVKNKNKTHEMSITDDSHFNMSLRKACIIPVWWGDVYITPQEIMPEEIIMGNKKMPTGAMITVTAKPCIRFVWFGLILIALGLLLNITTLITIYTVRK